MRSGRARRACLGSPPSTAVGTLAPFPHSFLLDALDCRQVMFKYVDICVEMKAGRKCKDALINYRNACQQVGSDLQPGQQHLQSFCSLMCAP